MIIEKLESPEDVKKLSASQKETLCSEIREILIENVSKTGGHLASNLGVVELTVALFDAFDFPKDKVIWDVGHQAYTHKILSGRLKNFDTLRQFGGLSGFPSPSESGYDAFHTGHSSTSISAALGIKTASRLNSENINVIAVIGDGAMTGGLSFEGLNNAGAQKEKIIVILNDNEMSISKNVGRMSEYLAKIRNRNRYYSFKIKLAALLRHIPLIGSSLLGFLTKLKSALKGFFYNNSTMFEDLGFAYLGPVDGHDLSQLSSILNRAKLVDEPVLIHIRTVKGKGYEPAENAPSIYHGTPSFDKITGIGTEVKESFTSVFSECLCKEASDSENIVAVTAAMEDGTGLSEFHRLYPERFFDVGIAEEHALTFAAGMSKGGKRAVVAVYSTFLQRAYDGILHDCAIMNADVTLAIDRAGITGEDGVTHQGIYDTSFLRSIPNIEVYAPSDYTDLRIMLHKALSGKGLNAVRYPRGAEPKSDILLPEPENTENGRLYKEDGSELLLVSYGREFYRLAEAREILKEKGLCADILKIDRIIPTVSCGADLSKYRYIFFIEEGVKSGGIGEGFYSANDIKGKFLHRALEGFVPHGDIGRLLEEYRLRGTDIADMVLEELKNGGKEPS